MHCPHIRRPENQNQERPGVALRPHRCAAFWSEPVEGVYLAAVCLTSGYRSCPRLPQPQASQPRASQRVARSTLTEIAPLSPSLVPPKPARQSESHPSPLFTPVEFLVLSLGITDVFVFLFVALCLIYQPPNAQEVASLPLLAKISAIVVPTPTTMPTPPHTPVLSPTAVATDVRAESGPAQIAAAHVQEAADEAPTSEPTAQPAQLPVTRSPAPPSPTSTQLPQTPLPPAPTPTQSPSTPTLTPTQPPAAKSLSFAASSLADTPAPTLARAPADSPPTRLVIPRIGLDVPVRPVGAKQIENDGQAHLIWNTLPDAACFHQTSAYPGHPGNTVINGHRDVGQAVFRSLDQVAIGDAINVYAGDSVYVYHVTEKLIVPHTRASPEQHAENQRLIGYLPEERLTLITCTPIGSTTHRLLVIAKPPADR